MVKRAAVASCCFCAVSYVPSAELWCSSSNEKRLHKCAIKPMFSIAYRHTSSCEDRPCLSQERRKSFATFWFSTFVMTFLTVVEYCVAALSLQIT